MKDKAAVRPGSGKKKNIIIAREQYSSLIEKEFDNLLMGDFGLNIITGEAGVGKTWLVNRCEDLFLSNNSIYIKVKFTQYNQDFFTPIINVIDEINRHILTLDKDSYALVSGNLKKELKSDCGIITTLSPYAQKIFGTKNKESSIEDISENKISEAIYHMLKASSKVLFPLVVFIDDLQWADSISLNVIHRICRDRAFINMHLILAYRNQANKDVDEQFLHCEKAKLSAFNAENVKEYISLFFDCEIENQDMLKQLIFNLTKGNPFYLHVIANQMLKDNIIIKKASRCIADIDRMANLELSENIKEVMLAQINSLSREEIEILQLISCFGGMTDKELLAIFFPGFGDRLEGLLDELYKKALLLTQYNDGRPTCGFVHDIVYDVIYNMQTEKERACRYAKIAGVLKKTGYSKKYPLLAASFLLKTDKNHIGKDEADAWIDILAKAGEAAQNRGSIKQALKIYELCDEFIKTGAKKPDDAFYLDFQLSYIRCLFINEKEVAAEKLYEYLLNQCTRRDDAVRIKLMYIYCYAYSANWEKVLSLGTDILNYLHFGFNTASMPLNLFQSRLIYSNRKIETIKDAPLITDRRILTILEVLVIMFPAANRLDLNTFNLLTLKLAFLSGKYGNSKYSAIGYAAYCYVLYFVFGDFQKGDRLQKITLDLLSNPDVESNRSIVYAIIGTFTYHWTNTFCDTLACLEQSIQCGEEEGEYLYSNYATVFSIITRYVMGRSLDEIEDYINRLKSKKERLENYLTRHMCRIYLSQINFLRTGRCSAENSIDESKQSFYDTISLNADMIKLHRLYLESQFLQAYELAKQTEPLVKKHKGFVLNGDFRFYSTLARIAAHSSLVGRERQINRKIIERNLKILHRWSDVFAPNHSARYYLSRAQYDFYIKGVGYARQDYYFMAIEQAEKENNIQLEGLANLLAARHYRYNQKLARLYAAEATGLYQRWGAGYIATLIRDEFGIEEKDPARKKQRENETNEKAVLEDLSHISALPEEKAWFEIMDYLIDNHYADYCRIFFESKKEMYLKYSKGQNEKSVMYENPVNINYIDKVPHKLIRYVGRTERPVILMADDDKGIFTNDLLLCGKETVSTACVPIRQFDVLIGIIYLELCKETGQNVEKIVQMLLSLLPPKKYSAGRKSKAKKGNILTARETQIMKLISIGMSNSQISEKLFIAEGTVRNHLSKIYDKLGVDNRMQAVVYAKENNLIK